MDIPGLCSVFWDFPTVRSFFIYVVWLFGLCLLYGLYLYAMLVDSSILPIVTVKPVIMNRFMSSTSVHPGFHVLYVCWREILLCVDWNVTLFSVND